MSTTRLLVTLMILAGLLIPIPVGATCGGTPTPSPKLRPTHTPNAMGTIEPLPTLPPLTRVPTILPGGAIATQEVNSDLIVRGTVYQYDYRTVTMLVDERYKGTTNGVLRFNYRFDPCDYSTYVIRRGEPVILFLNRHANGELYFRSAYIDEAHILEGITEVTGQPVPVVPLSVPLAIVFFLMNLGVWSIVITRRIVRTIEEASTAQPTS